MSLEQWKDIPGFEGRYQISDQGRVKSLPFMQRYVLRNGNPAMRKTKERILATQLINSGYRIVHLHLDNSRKALLVHRLVAEAFYDGVDTDVNHKNGCKTENNRDNLEWCTRSHNHDHAVDLGLNKQAIKVRLIGGESYPSIARAARLNKTSIGTITRSAARRVPTLGGEQWEYA